MMVCSVPCVLVVRALALFNFASSFSCHCARQAIECESKWEF